MDKNEIRLYSVAKLTVNEETAIEAHWHRGSGVNIYVNGNSVDYFTNYLMKSDDDFLEAFANYLQTAMGIKAV